MTNLDSLQEYGSRIDSSLLPQRKRKISYCQQYLCKNTQLLLFRMTNFPDFSDSTCRYLLGLYYAF